MRKAYSPAWKGSSQRRKQRKFRVRAPRHVQHRFVAAALSKELRKTHKRRSAGLRKGDKVSVMRGNFRKKTGKIEQVNVRDATVYVAGIEVAKKDGTKVFRPIAVSNVMITELKMDDKMRQKALKAK